MDLMSERQWKRWDAVARLGAGTLTTAEAARVLALSVRQVRRVRRRIEQYGRAGLIHGNTGRAPANKLAAAVRRRIVQLRREKFDGFNDHHFTEKLAAESAPIAVTRATVRRGPRRAGGAAGGGGGPRGRPRPPGPAGDPRPPPLL